MLLGVLSATSKSSTHAAPDSGVSGHSQLRRDIPIAQKSRSNSQDPRKALAVYDHALARPSEIKPNASSQLAEADLLVASSYAARRIGRGEDARGRIKNAFLPLRDLHIYPADKVEPMSEADDALQAQADDYAETGQIVKANHLPATPALPSFAQIGRNSNLHTKILGNFVMPPVVFCSPRPHKALTRYRNNAIMQVRGEQRIHY
jgi:hypothetical protein